MMCGMPHRSRAMVTEQTLRETLGGACWEITSLTSETVQLPHEDTDAAFWLVQAQRR